MHLFGAVVPPWAGQKHFLPEAVKSEQAGLFPVSVIVSVPVEPEKRISNEAMPFPGGGQSKLVVPPNPDAASGLADEWLYLAFCERDAGAARLATAAMTPEGYTNEGFLFPRAWCEGLTARMRGDPAAERASFAAARIRVEEGLRAEPDHPQALSVLGMIDAALGHKEEAIRESRGAVESLPLGKDSINGALAIEYLAVTYAWTGEADQALEQLKRAATIPSEVTYGQLRLHPYWDALRGDPRFEKIVASLAPATGQNR